MFVYWTIIFVIGLCFSAVAEEDWKSPYPADRVDRLAAEGTRKLSAFEKKIQPDKKCTLENAARRKEW